MVGAFDRTGSKENVVTKLTLHKHRSTKGAESPAGHAGHRPPAFMVAVLVPVALLVTLACFAWPSARLEPRDLPLGVAGPAQSTQAIEHELASRPGTFDVHRYADERSARGAIEDRDVYGAIVATPEGSKLLTASAASPLIANTLRQHFALANGGAELPVVDVVPADPDDPRGSAFGSAVFPLILASVVAAVFVVKAARPGLGAAAALVTACALGGLTAVAIVQGWLGVVGGDWLVNAGVLALTILAIASFLVGLTWLLGNAGLALAAPLMILIGNPWSGISSAPELLPEPTGLVGQLMPPGAGGNLLRSTAFFDNGGAAGPLAVLLGWTALGLGAMAAGVLVHRRRAARAVHAVEPELDLPRAA
jgi:hypothetical protein